MALFPLVITVVTLLSLGIIGIVLWCRTPRRLAIAGACFLALIPLGMLVVGSIDDQRQTGHAIRNSDFLGGWRTDEPAEVLAEIVEEVFLRTI